MKVALGHTKRQVDPQRYVWFEPDSMQEEQFIDVPVQVKHLVEQLWQIRAPLSQYPLRQLQLPLGEEDSDRKYRELHDVQVEASADVHYTQVDAHTWHIEDEPSSQVPAGH